jgi:hypothetical protein
MRGYVSRQEFRQNDSRKTLDVWFTSNPEAAWNWGTREEAQAACKYYEDLEVTINSALGGTHICSGFKSQARKPGEFIVFCDAPFIPERSTN